MLNNLIDRIKLPFRKEKELYSSLYDILGFYPRNIQYYKLALMHKSIMHRGANGKPVNNERLEFLGDAILDAVVGDIVYRRFPGKREGFLTNTRSKLVQRETLNRLAREMGVCRLILSSGSASSHNNYMGGNAFEALVGAIYLDRGYAGCMQFMERRILNRMINIEKVAYKEVNFKSKLIEWSQKNRIRLDFVVKEQGKDKNGSPFFFFCAVLEGIEGSTAKGYSKKESQQLASKLTLERLKKEPKFIDEVFAAKTNRTKMEEEPVEGVPDTEEKMDFLISSEQLISSETSLQESADISAEVLNDTTVADNDATETCNGVEEKTSDNLIGVQNDAPKAFAKEKKQTERQPRGRKKKNDISANNVQKSGAEELSITGDTVSEPSDADVKAERVAPKKAKKPASKVQKSPRGRKKKVEEVASAAETSGLDLENDPDFDLSHITAVEQTREEIIAAAEAAAFGESISSAQEDVVSADWSGKVS